MGTGITTIKTALSEDPGHYNEDDGTIRPITEFKLTRTDQTDLEDHVTTEEEKDILIRKIISIDSTKTVTELRLLTILELETMLTNLQARTRTR